MQGTIALLCIAGLVLLLVLVFALAPSAPATKRPDVSRARYVRLDDFYGRLGNRLFQYAAAKALALDCKAELHLPHNLLRMRKSSASLPNEIIYTAPSGHSFDPNFFNQKGPDCDSTITLKDSYFQSEKYFKPYWPEICEDFKLPKIQLSDLFPTLSLHAPVVGIHVRRTDYLISPSEYFVIDVPYIESRMAWFRKHVSEECQFVFFSDDINWCEDNFPFELHSRRHFFSKSHSELEDLALLSQCHHFIISASTFSWWGAYLGRTQNKIVLTPPYWFHPQGKFAHLKQDDLYPSEWRRPGHLPSPSVLCHSFSRPESTSFFVSGGSRVLFAEAYLKDGHLVLISHFYPDLKIDFANDVEIRCENHILRFASEVGFNGDYEPDRIVRFRLPHELEERHTLRIQVRYKHQEQIFILAHTSPQKKKMRLCTLFFHEAEFKMIETVFRYYSLQGVDEFVLYYNGDLKKVWHKLFHHPNIIYGSWNFSYWDQRVEYAHHAQTMFINYVRDRYGDASEFMILNDLDEFISTSDKSSLYFYLRKQVPFLFCGSEYFVVKNLFCTYTHLGPHSLTLLPDSADLGLGWAKRNKTIYSHQYKGRVMIHLPRWTEEKEKNVQDFNLKFYHIMNFGQYQDRNNWVKNPGKEIVLRLS